MASHQRRRQTSAVTTLARARLARRAGPLGGCLTSQVLPDPPPHGAANTGPALSSPLGLPVSNRSLRTEPKPPCLKKRNRQFTSPSGFLFKTTAVPPGTPSEGSAVPTSNTEGGHPWAGCSRPRRAAHGRGAGPGSPTLTPGLGPHVLVSPCFNGN